MLKIIRLTLLLAAMVISFSQRTYALDDAIIAVVNNELITMKDLKDYINSTYVSMVAQGVEEDRIKEMMADLKTTGLQQLIEDKLILSKANEIGLSVRPELVDEKIEAVKKKYGSEQSFLDSLVKNGANVTDLRKKIEDGLKIKYVIDHEVKSKIFVNPQEVTDFYEKNPEKFKSNEKANIDSIYISFGDNKNAAKSRAEEAYQLLKEGKDFMEVANKYSQGPSIGVVERGQLLAVIEKEVFNLKINEISVPLEVDSGIFIFKMRGKLPSKTQELNEVKSAIHNHLFQTKFRNRLLDWVKKLKDKAYVEIKN